MSDLGQLTPTEEKAFRSKVKEALNAYDDVGKDFRERLVAWLTDGEDGTCLLELPAELKNKPQNSFFDMQHGLVMVRNEANRRRLLQLFDLKATPAGFWKRLGELAMAIPEVSLSYVTEPEYLPDWFEALFNFQFLLRIYTHLGGTTQLGYQVAPWMSELMDEIGVEATFRIFAEKNSRFYSHMAHHLKQANDWKDLLEEHSEVVCGVMQFADKAAQNPMVEWLDAASVDLSKFRQPLAAYAITGHRHTRASALRLLRKDSINAAESVAYWLREGSAAQRSKAVEVLVALIGKDAEPLLQEALKVEKGKRVKQTIETALLCMQESPATVESGDESAGESIAYNFEPIEMPTGVLPLPAGFEAAFLGALEDVYRKLYRDYERQLEQYNSPDRPPWMAKPSPPEKVNTEQVREAIAYIEGKQEKHPKLSQIVGACRYHMSSVAWAPFGELHLLHVLRFMDYMEWIDSHRGDRHLYFLRQDFLDAHRAAQQTPYTLREVEAAVRTLPEYRNVSVGALWLNNNNSWQTFLDWDDEAIWPLFAEKPELIRDALRTPDSSSYGYHTYGCSTAIRVARMMPQLPAGIETMLWSVALGETKTDRPQAQAALLKVPTALQRSLTALADGKQAIRIAAAEMLRDLKDETAVEPLKTALRKEKQEIVKGAMLQAIEALGGDVEEFLGRRKQLNDAKKGLEKKRPKGMEWVPLEGFPKVRWEDGTAVAPDIVQWWIVQSIQFKLPTPGALLKRSLEMCQSQDTAQLAAFVLSAWIAHDTKTMDHEEAVAQATQQAASQWQSHKWYRESYKTEEKLRASILSEIEHTFVQSAIGQKGMLAIVAAAGDATCVRMMERYIRKYHGHRTAQCKVLLDVLAWVDDPGGVQVLLSISNRFRTKGIRKYAEELVGELAERRGWTMEQLADRTIPDAGFARETDDDGNPIGDRAELVLDYGSRTFTVILSDDLQPVITRDDGKQLKSLPAAAKDDDPELVKAAKKEFSAAKKSVKEIVKSLGERFYEAACVQRSWSAAEWQTFLANHPVAGALCCRVIWAAKTSEDDASPRLFRPLEDRTLTDVNDDKFQLNETDVIVVAHSSLLDKDTETDWKQHLEDYEVPELFQQFGREAYQFPDDKAKETEIRDYEGHMLTTFQLRGKATKLGWVRGSIEDAGSFWMYYKSFPSLRINVVLEFSGSYVPEEDIPAALGALYFTRQQSKDDSAPTWNPSKLKLSAVPPVLLSECYNDVRDIAAVGSGFDKEWQKKGLW